jgi:hypothetical protein
MSYYIVTGFPFFFIDSLASTLEVKESLRHLGKADVEI